VQKIAVVFFTQNLFILASIIGLVFYSMFYGKESDSKGVSLVFAVIIFISGLIGILGFTVDHFPDSVFAKVTLFNDIAHNMEFYAWLILIMVFGYFAYGFTVGKESNALKNSFLTLFAISSIVFLLLILQTTGVLEVFTNLNAYKYTSYAILGVIFCFVLYGFMTTTFVEYSRMIVLILLIVSTIVFWALFEQSAGSMTLFADRVVDRKLVNSNLGAVDVWRFYTVGIVFIALALWGFISANRYRKMHNSNLKVVMMPTLVVGALVAVLGISKFAYDNGATWISNLSYLGIFILLLVSVMVAISLAFILIGFFYKKDKSNEITEMDSSTSASSISVFSVTLIMLGGLTIYYGLTEFGSLTDGATKPFVFEPTAGQFGSLNALFIFTLAPVFAALWVKLGKHNMDPSTPVKFSLGLIQVGLGFGALLLGAMFPGESGKVAWIWLALAYLIHTTAELSLSPVGLSAVTKLSIKSVVSMVMGVWFLATALSEVVAALLARIAALDANELTTLSIAGQLDKYNELWVTLIWMGVIIGGFMLLISYFLKKGMKGIH
jgi:dipeptide/tripeptide permease